ncbi:Protein Disulfide Isomerase [Carpediemonas membranifera]|uniref:Protein Disulfide Isomerase n=1 Tax=Carpediemonas membranifera TaxID=201153 RepID=A0A8J6AUB5_9EUKA|nr:Protein Disulfide Isomerase [Carpediemonas membranifera]|eukprot:KAG9394921.1 Protein Disulfide Isomerase [Carpediemonas membranifera]
MNRLCLFALLALVIAPAVVAELVEFTPDDDFSVVAHGPSVVKFYAGWCPHCQAYAPVFETVAEMLDGTDIAVYSVNCEDNEKLCHKHMVRGYPTTRYYEQNVLPIDYQGARDAQAITSWAQRLAGPEIVESTLEKTGGIDTLTAGHDVFFVVNLDATEVELKMVSHAAAVYKGETLTVGLTEYDFDIFTGKAGLKLVVSRENRLESFDEDLTPEGVLGFFEVKRFQVMPELGRDNFQAMAQAPGRRMLIGCIDPQEPYTVPFKSTLRAIAEQYEHMFVSSWINGVAWAPFVGRYGIDVDEMPALLVLNIENNRFITQKSLSHKDLADVVEAIASGAIEEMLMPDAHPRHGLPQWKVYLMELAMLAGEYPVVTTAILLTTTIGLCFSILRIVCGARANAMATTRSAGQAAEAEKKDE